MQNQYNMKQATPIMRGRRCLFQRTALFVQTIIRDKTCEVKCVSVGKLLLYVERLLLCEITSVKKHLMSLKTHFFKCSLCSEQVSHVC